MSRSGPRIMLLAKMSDVRNINFDMDILKDIQPTEIPRDFIVRVDVTFSTGKRMEFDTSRINRNFTVDEIQDFLHEYDRNGLVQLIEITLDLEKIYKTIQQDCDSIFSKLFP
jgi:hypothetical protein